MDTKKLTVWKTADPFELKTMLELHENLSNTVCIEKDNAYLFSKEMILSLHQKEIRTNVFIGPFGQKHDDFFEKYLDQAFQKYLISMVYSQKDFDYQNYGFEPVIYHYKYNIPVSDIPDYSFKGIVIYPEVKILKKIYDQFTDHFNAYFIRSEDDFSCLLKKWQKASYQVAALHEDAYVVYKREKSHVIVIELCYQKSGDIYRLLNYVSRGLSRAIYIASENEQITRLFPNSQRIKEVFLYAKVNDRYLFETLYKIKIISAYSAFHAFAQASFNRSYIL